MNSSLTVAICQLTSGEDVGLNADQIFGLLSQLKEKVDLVCLPENALFFRVAKTTAVAEIDKDDSVMKRMQIWADQNDSGMMIGSVPFREGDHLSSATVFLRPGEPAAAVYRKIHMFDVDVPGAPPSRESHTYRHGPKPAIVEWRGWKLGLTICYDIRFSELFLQYAREQVDAVLVPAAFLVPTGKEHWEILARARAIESQCFLIAAAQGGEVAAKNGEKRSTYGHSMIVGPWGEKLAELNDKDRIASVRLERSEIEKVRRQIPMREHRAQRRWENA